MKAEDVLQVVKLVVELATELVDEVRKAGHGGDKLDALEGVLTGLRGAVNGGEAGGDPAVDLDKLKAALAGNDAAADQALADKFGGENTDKET